MTLVDKILERVKALYNDMAYVWGKCNELADWDTWEEIKAKWPMLQDLSMRAVLCVESVSNDIKTECQQIASSKEKRDAAVAYVDSMIKLPGYMEWVDNMLIGYFVDTAVTMLNKKYGKAWGTDKANIAKVAKAEGAGH